MEARQFWDTFEILLIFIVRFFFVLLLSFTWRSPACRRLGCPEEAGKEINLYSKSGWLNSAGFGSMQNITEKMDIGKLGLQSQKLTFWNFLGSSCLWKEATRYKGEAFSFINHIRTLLWNFLVWLFPQKPTQRTFKSRPEHKSRHKFVTLVMEAGCAARKGSFNGTANSHNRINLYPAISSKVQPAENSWAAETRKEPESTSGHSIWYLLD